jgi:hypothetical protein
MIIYIIESHFFLIIFRIAANIIILWNCCLLTKLWILGFFRMHLINVLIILWSCRITKYLIEHSYFSWACDLARFLYKLSSWKLIFRNIEFIILWSLYFYFLYFREFSIIIFFPKHSKESSTFIQLNLMMNSHLDWLFLHINSFIIQTFIF